MSCDLRCKARSKQPRSLAKFTTKIIWIDALSLRMVATRRQLLPLRCVTTANAMRHRCFCVADDRNAKAAVTSRQKQGVQWPYGTTTVTTLGFGVASSLLSSLQPPPRVASSGRYLLRTCRIATRKQRRRWTYAKVTK